MGNGLPVITRMIITITPQGDTNITAPNRAKEYIMKALENIIKIVRYRETNPYHNPATANNGGGYHQPQITGWVGETPFTLWCHNCGDFGRTYYLTMGRGKNARHYVTGDMGEREYMPARVFPILRAILRAANL